MKHYGDVTKLNGAELPAVDVITGGSPCQDLSVAGKRAGLAGERSGLFMEQIRVIKEMRQRDRDSGRTGINVRPRYMVWENVPGAFSSNAGEDFRAVLEETAHIADKNAAVPQPTNGKWTTSGAIVGDGWSIAWRVLDAQFWGVPQRRRRIALVADFGGQSAPEILFIRNGLSWDTSESGEAGERTAGDAERSADGAVCVRMREGCAGGGKGPLIQAEKSGTLGTGNDQFIAYSFDSLASNSMKSKNPNSGCREVEISKTLDCFDPNPSKNQGGIAIVYAPAICIQGDIARGAHFGQNGKGWQENISYTLDRIDTPAVFDARGSGDGVTAPTMTGDHENRITDYTALCIGNGQANQSADEIAGALNCMHDQQAIMKGCSVRHLTPLECERLQGYPQKEKLDLSKMTKDEYIAWNIVAGNIVVDADKGKVFATRGPGGIVLEKPREMSGSDNNGYLVVSIRNGTTKMSCRVHRIIWISQNGVIPEGFVVDHINSNKKDNRICNLQLLTTAENSLKAKEDGLYCSGEDNKATKLSPDLWDEIAYLYEFSDMTIRELADTYGVSKSRINQIIRLDGWTDIGEWTDSKGKVHKPSDSARYKALGNSIALPPWRWVLLRITAQYERPATLGSLFDGIGGFPLIWERLNGDGTCLWASEIEEFCIAVTRLRFERTVRA